MRTVRLIPLLLALLASACVRWTRLDGSEEHGLLTDYVEDVREGLAEKRKGASPVDVEMAIRTRSKASGGAFGFLRFNRNLHAPYRVSIVGGLGDPAENTGFVGNAQFCMELDRRDTVTDDPADLRFVLICARAEGDGLRVRAQDQFAQLGSRLFPATKVVELAIEHDGADLVFSAGPGTFEGSDAMVEIARVAAFPTSGAWLPSYGASFLEHPAMVSFDRGRVEASGPRPSGLTASQELAYDLHAAFDGLLEAVYDLDGFEPDPASARMRLAAAATVLETAQAAASALDGGKAARRARSRLKSARRAVAKAVAAIDREKSQKQVAKSAGLALGATLAAVEALDPLP